MTLTTILIVDDHSVVREALCSLLQFHQKFQVVGEASTGREAVEQAAALQPAVVIMDIVMPDLDGFEATRQILRVAAASRVLALSAYRSETCIEDLLSAGVSGYLAKQESGETFTHALREIAAGRTFFSPSALRRIASLEQSGVGTGIERGRRQKPLTPRESEVLEQVANGAGNKQIATDMGISVKTVEKHRQQLMDKLDIHETAGLTRYAFETGVVFGLPEKLESVARQGKTLP